MPKILPSLKSQCYDPAFVAMPTPDPVGSERDASSTTPRLSSVVQYASEKDAYEPI